MDNIPSDQKKTWSNRDIFLLKDSKTNRDGTYGLNRSFNEKCNENGTCAKDKKRQLKFIGYIIGRRLEEFYAHKTCQK